MTIACRVEKLLPSECRQAARRTTPPTWAVYLVALGTPLLAFLSSRARTRDPAGTPDTCTDDVVPRPTQREPLGRALLAGGRSAPLAQNP